MKEESQNLFAAVVLSLLIIFGVNHFFGLREAPQQPKQEETAAPAIELSGAKETQSASLPLEDALAQDDRIIIQTPAVTGSIRLKGARFDSLSLNKYKETLEPNSPNVQLLSPAQTQLPYFAEFGFLAQNPDMVPNASSLWTADRSKLSPDSPVTLKYDSGTGLIFTRKISIDNNYLITISDTVLNNSNHAVELYPFGRINRTYNPKSQNRSVVHEGITGVIDSSAKEIKLTEIKENKPKTFEAQTAWLGFSDRYWFTAFILDGKQPNTLSLSKTGNADYQADFRGEAIRLAPYSSKETSVKFFAGAKEVKLLDQYTKGGIEKFDLAVDFGWYYFLTKPFFYILNFLYRLIGNMGWAILLFAAILRVLMFPIANKSFESMSKMKKIQPKIIGLQNTYKNDKLLLQQKTMELYKKEKINPASGCLPMFIQIPIFFSLYKVLNIAIEIRHAPFIGWIKDLSAPDPLTISVWSHIPLPYILDIGVWPILMGVTMWLQQKLNPAPTNKDQAKMFAMLPFIFTLMLGHFASGLVIYWTLSNILSLIQQKMIMHKNGVK